jgi:CBS domain-containing protein
MVGMGALVSAATRGTLTAILMIFEMTQAYQMILPLLFACVIADMVSSMGSPETIYTRKLLRRGTRIVQDLEPNVMQMFSVKDVMVAREDVVTISPDDQLHKMVAVIRRTGHNGFPVIDEEGRLVGVVTHEDTRRAHNSGDLFVTANELMTRDMVAVTPYETAEVALRRMGERRISHLPVVDPYDSTKLMGWISKGDLVFGYEEYHRRMEAPITDEAVEVVEEVGAPETPEEMEERLKRPSLLSRTFRRKAKKTETPTEVEPITEAVEVVVIEREEPPRRPRGEGAEEEPSTGALPDVREPSVSAEEAGWEEEPARRRTPDRRTQKEWEEEPEGRPEKGTKGVDRLRKRSL